MKQGSAFERVARPVTHLDRATIRQYSGRMANLQTLSFVGLKTKEHSRLKDSSCCRARTDHVLVRRMCLSDIEIWITDKNDNNIVCV